MLASIRRFFGSGRRGRPALLLAAALTVGACDDDDDPIDPGPATEWAADLSGEGDYEDVTGAIIVLASDDALAAEIEIDGAADGDVFAWGVHEGTCATPGERIGDADAYPDLEAGANGAATAEADQDVGLESGQHYIIQVTEEGGDEPVVVACSALSEVDD